ncbi:hypothetical protein [Methylobacterium sp. J-067]|uniref:hypothetical protein n=1 Tax=Methylobacterium sp. J-067 TaxID=2836648 RepID=UPI001FB94E4F|nr:hypothetical protein [Methylobacterium sp. J-067]MCJ2025162.1 hypothetical protein [Methylobacterium sp. J-067]
MTMAGDLRRRVERLEQTAPGTAPFVRIYFEPRPCADPIAFGRECEADAAAIGCQSAVVIRFVKPGDVLPVGPLQ